MTPKKNIYFQTPLRTDSCDILLIGRNISWVKQLEESNDRSVIVRSIVEFP